MNIKLNIRWVLMVAALFAILLGGCVPGPIAGTEVAPTSLVVDSTPEKTLLEISTELEASFRSNSTGCDWSWNWGQYVQSLEIYVNGEYHDSAVRDGQNALNVCDHGFYASVPALDQMLRVSIHAYTKDREIWLDVGEVSASEMGRLPRFTLYPSRCEVGWSQFHGPMEFQVNGEVVARLRAANGIIKVCDGWTDTPQSVTVLFTEFPWGEIDLGTIPAISE